MLAAALTGLSAAMIAGEFNAFSIAALTIGLAALLTTGGLVLVALVTRKWQPQSGPFTWSDVDNLRNLAMRLTTDAETREWARSLADRIAVVLPPRR